MRLRLPDPLLLMLGGVAVAAALTWVLPAGQFQRRDDESTGRRVVVAGTYHAVPAQPVGPFAAAMAVPRGLVEAAEVVAVVLLVGGAWVVVDRLGTLGRVVASLLALFRYRAVPAVCAISLFFIVMGALANMQEEIIPLIPVLLLLGRRLGIDKVSIVAMSAGAAMVGSAFGPTNPFQAGIASQLAEVSPFAVVGVRAGTFAAACALWIGWTAVRAARMRVPPEEPSSGAEGRLRVRDLVILGLMLTPMAVYVYGAVALGWGFNELSAGFLVGGLTAGLVGRLGPGRTAQVYVEGMQILLPAAVVVGVARAISLVLADGRIIDTILHALSVPLGQAPAVAAALLMVPFHAIVHVVVPSVSGHAVLTLPLLVPLSDLLGISRHVTVLAYQTGAGLAELLTPTNGALMAILIAAGVPYPQWLRFAAAGTALAALAGLAGMVALQMGAAVW